MLNETSRQVKSYLINTDGKTLKALGIFALSSGSAYIGYQAYPYLNSVSLPSNQINFNNNFTNPYNSTPPYWQDIQEQIQNNKNFSISFEFPINSTNNTQTLYYLTSRTTKDLANQITHAQQIGNETEATLNNELTETTTELSGQILNAQQIGNDTEADLQDKLNSAYQTGNATETELNNELTDTRERFEEVTTDLTNEIGQIQQESDATALDLANQITHAQQIGNETEATLNNELTETTTELSGQILNAQQIGNEKINELENILKIEQKPNRDYQIFN
jgi:hypothetical protein